MVIKRHKSLVQADKDIEKALKTHDHYFNSPRLEELRRIRTGASTSSGAQRPDRGEPNPAPKAGSGAEKHAPRHAAPAAVSNGRARRRALPLKGYFAFTLMLMALFLGGFGYLVYLIWINLE